MRRRHLLRTGAAGLAGLAGPVAGCTGAPADPVATPLGRPVTTSAAPAVAIPVAQVVIGEDAPGPAIYYRLVNEGDRAATVKLRTVLLVDGGGSYEATAAATIPAGGELRLQYQLVTFDRLSSVEARRVRRGDATFETYLNGERRAV